MAAQPTVRFDPDDVQQRLAELSLDVDMFVIAAQKALAAYLDTTPNDPPTYPGTAAWAAATRALREEGISRRWGRRLDEFNLPMVINDAGTMAIAASSGNKETGKPDGFPRTRSAKGSKTVGAVHKNKQLKLEFEDPTPIIESLRVVGRATWLFLMFRDFINREIRYELSRPISMTEEGHVDEWAERLIFPPTPFGDDAPKVDRSPGGDGQSPQIIVEIKKLA